jgi:hypothetical protein
VDEHERLAASGVLDGEQRHARSIVMAGPEIVIR